MQNNVRKHATSYIFVFSLQACSVHGNFIPSELKSRFSLVPNWLFSFKAVIVYKVIT
jgi:hypothetical protein